VFQFRISSTISPFGCAVQHFFRELFAADESLSDLFDAAIDCHILLPVATIRFAFLIAPLDSPHFSTFCRECCSPPLEWLESSKRFRMKALPT